MSDNTGSQHCPSPPQRPCVEWPQGTRREDEDGRVRPTDEEVRQQGPGPESVRVAALGAICAPLRPRSEALAGEPIGVPCKDPTSNGDGARDAGARADRVEPVGSGGGRGRRRRGTRSGCRAPSPAGVPGARPEPDSASVQWVRGRRRAGRARSGREDSAPRRGDALHHARGRCGRRGGRRWGEPLPSAERRFFETRLGHDLSRVRVHADRPAAEAARAIDADAFTLRNDVAFAEGLYQPGSESGRHLLAHELVHVIQQGEAAPLPGAGAPPVQGGSGGPQIARQATGTMETSPTQAPAAEISPAPAPAAARAPSADASEPATAGGGLVVEDDAQALTTGQLRKSQLLSRRAARGFLFGRRPGAGPRGP